MDKLLKLLDENARLTDAQLAVMLNMTEKEVGEHLAALEKAGVVRGYKALIDWDRRRTAGSMPWRKRSCPSTRWRASA